MEDFVTGMHANKRLNALRRSLLRRYARSQAPHLTANRSDDTPQSYNDSSIHSAIMEYFPEKLANMGSP